MKAATKALLIAILPFILVACSGNPGPSGSGGTGGTGGSGSTFTIGGTVSGLTGSGLVLQDNGGNNLSLTTSGSFTFSTAIASGKAYAVTVLTQPSNPTQTCTVTNGSGTATAVVTNIQVACGTGTVTIGGSVTGLQGSGLVLQDNGGANLTVNASGTFVFGTALNVGATYNVTVLTQPSSPAQVCTVASGSGTAGQNIGTVVVTCSIGTLSLGGSVSGLAGSGLVLQDNAGTTASITSNGPFTFSTLIPGGAYSVTIATQPSNPSQTCTITNASGTATANVTNVQVICPAVFNTIGGQIVGLSIPSGQTASGILQDNGGDNLPFSQNGAFTFVTPIAYGSTYDVTLFVAPTTQTQGSRRYFYQGAATADVTNVVVDFGHNDWTWIDGANTSNQFGNYTAPTGTTIDTSTPGGVRYPATWTDNSGNLWIFSGYGYSSVTTQVPQPWWYQEMWTYAATADYQGSLGDYWSLITPSGGSVPAGRWGAVTWTNTSTGNLYLFGGQDQFTDFLNDVWFYNISAKTWTQVSTGSGINQTGVYGTKGSATGGMPGGRWGATARVDGSGNLWLFGGYGYDSTGATGLLNDLWEYTGGNWIWMAGSNLVNPDGVYGTEGTSAGTNVPGGRQASMSWIDTSGNFWLFGGYNLSSGGQPTAFNDLWEFNVTTKQWTWVAGANVVNQTGVYGTQGIAASTNVPGARWSSAAWADMDLSGNSRFWLFGGQGFDSTGDGSLGDLWVFTKGQWTWVKGPNSVDQKGVYGQAVTPITWPFVGNDPGSRWGSGYWVDHSGQFWMFGGEGFDSTGTTGDGLLNDLWRYLPFPY